MKKNIKSALSFLLLAAMMTAATACGDSAETTAPAETTSAVETETAEVTDSRVNDSLPEDLDFGGETVTIHARGDNDSFAEIYSEEADGDILHDAIYNRNKAVEERLNVKLEAVQGATWESYGSDLQKIVSSVLAGDTPYSLIAGWGMAIASYATRNCFLDLQDVQYLNTEQPWWNQSAVNGMNLGGHLFFLTGDLCAFTLFGGSYVLYINDRLATDHDIDNIIPSIDDGTWTIDKMNTIIKDFGQDIDGDGKRGDNDLYGLILDKANSTDAFYTAADMHQIFLNEDGDPEYRPDVDRLSKLVEKIYPLYQSTGFDAYVPEEVTTGENMFINGQGLLFNRELSESYYELRDMEDSFTIIPYPKLDEAQENYQVNAYNGTALWCIPTTNPNADMAAAVMESMACESYNSVTQTYFENCLQDKFARNETTIRMLNLIRECMYLDSEYLYNASLGGTCQFLRTMLMSKKLDVASFMAKQEKTVNKAIEKTMKAFNEMES